MKKVYTGFIRVNRFFGVKAGRSVWKDSLLKTRSYSSAKECYSEMEYFLDVVIPATGAKIVGYFVEPSLVSCDEVEQSPCANCNAPVDCCPFHR